MSNVRTLDPGYYEALRRLTLELAGVKLGTDSEFLVETRLGALARQEGFSDLTSMIDSLFSEGKTRLAVNVVATLLERDMRFYDDKPGFETLAQTIVPSLYKNCAGRPLRILCYGCGSGQGVYSLAMTMMELTQTLPGLHYSIKGIDFPSRGLARAVDGRYTHFEVQRGLPARKLVKYFTREREDWVVTPALRETVDFQEFHLLSSLEAMGKFELILFRNALHRYAPSAQMRILRSLSPALVPGGYLMLGSEESLNDLNFGLDPVSSAKGFFKRRLPPPPPAEPVRPVRKDFN